MLNKGLDLKVPYEPIYLAKDMFSMLCSAQEYLESGIKLQEPSKVEDAPTVTEILNKETIEKQKEWDDILQMRKDVYGTLNA